jgi:hypothetical protein
MELKTKVYEMVQQDDDEPRPDYSVDYDNYHRGWPYHHKKIFVYEPQKLGGLFNFQSRPSSLEKVVSTTDNELYKSLLSLRVSQTKFLVPPVPEDGFLEYYDFQVDISPVVIGAIEHILFTLL